MNIYFLVGQANSSFEADDAAVIGSDIEGVLVECTLCEASELARKWGLNAPMLAKDGVYVSESGDEIFVANGEQVKKIETVAEALDWPGLYECGLDAEDYLNTINRVF